MNVFLLNGPPGVGKDLTGMLLAQMLPGSASIAKFANVLKVSVHAVIALMANLGKCEPSDTYEKDKDEPHPDFFGAKPRDAYIAMSELFAKPLFGKKIYGKVMERQIKDLKAKCCDHVVITDSGFSEEAQHLIDTFQDVTFHLIRINREGCDFDGDSRSYIKLEGSNVETHILDNPGELGLLRVAVAELLLNLEA
jgi:DNA polymerase III delta prime subunit